MLNNNDDDDDNNNDNKITRSVTFQVLLGNRWIHNQQIRRRPRWILSQSIGHLQSPPDTSIRPANIEQYTDVLLRKSNNVKPKFIQDILT